MKASSHQKIFARLAKRMSRLANAKGVSRGSRTAFAAAALLCEEIADAYAGAAKDGGTP